MGTEADLRKLKLSKARAVLRNFGVPEDEVRDYHPVFRTTNMYCFHLWGVIIIL